MPRAVTVQDEHFMQEALRLAARTPRRPWPNPPVGAVLVRDDRIVGRGAHQGAGTAHAEQVALAEAGSRADGATLYCTLEPCNHRGRTPPCAPAVAQSGVRRVVVGTTDPNPTVPGGGLALLRERGIEVSVGVCGQEALELIWPFVVSGAFARPFVLLKTATSLDGCFTWDDSRVSKSRPEFPYLTQMAARHDAHVLRRWMDLVLVGERTLAADKPRLDGRLVTPEDDCPQAEPAAGYVDTDLSFRGRWDRPRGYAFAGKERAAGDRLASGAGGRTAIVPCDELDGHVDPHSLLAEANRLGLHCIMVEGGPRLAAGFLRAGAVDRWVQYVAPIVVGSGRRWPATFPALAAAAGQTVADWTCTRMLTVGRDVRLDFDRRSFWDTLKVLAPAGGVDCNRTLEGL
jgi:diaminohydroxyphosphoribosylaminopyrimidine deaminase/5-amino-6-(5-phosphoribosylamino)uracil reductase